MIVGEKYVGDDNWYFCSINTLSGWDPNQIIEFIDDKLGAAKEDYRAVELNAEAQEIVIGLQKVNGWIWYYK